MKKLLSLVIISAGLILSGCDSEDVENAGRAVKAEKTTDEQQVKEDVTESKVVIENLLAFAEELELNGLPKENAGKLNANGTYSYYQPQSAVDICFLVGPNGPIASNNPSLVGSGKVNFTTTSVRRCSDGSTYFSLWPDATDWGSSPDPKDVANNTVVVNQAAGTATIAEKPGDNAMVISIADVGEPRVYVVRTLNDGTQFQMIPVEFAKVAMSSDDVKDTVRVFADGDLDLIADKYKEIIDLD